MPEEYRRVLSTVGDQLVDIVDGPALPPGKLGGPGLKGDETEIDGQLAELSVPEHTVENRLDKILPAQLRVAVDIGQQVHEHPAVNGRIGQRTEIDDVCRLAGGHVHQEFVLFRPAVVGEQLNLIVRAAVIKAQNGVQYAAACPEGGQGEYGFVLHHARAGFDDIVGARAEVIEISRTVLHSLARAEFKQLHIIIAQRRVQPAENQRLGAAVFVPQIQALHPGAEPVAVFADAVQRFFCFRLPGAQRRRVKQAAAVLPGGGTADHQPPVVSGRRHVVQLLAGQSLKQSGGAVDQIIAAEI